MKIGTSVNPAPSLGNLYFILFVFLLFFFTFELNACAGQTDQWTDRRTGLVMRPITTVS